MGEINWTFGFHLLAVQVFCVAPVGSINSALGLILALAGIVVVGLAHGAYDECLVVFQPPKDSGDQSHE